MTTDSQPGGFFDHHYMQRESISISFPIIHLSEIISKLKKHKLFVVISIGNSVSQLMFEKEELNLDNMLYGHQNNMFTTYLMGFSIPKEDCKSDEGKFTLAGKKYPNIPYNCKCKDCIMLPVTILKHREDCPCNAGEEVTYAYNLSKPNFPVAVVFKKDARGIFSEEFSTSVLKNIVTLQIINPEWGNLGYVFDIVKELTQSIKIDDINFT